MHPIPIYGTRNPSHGKPYAHELRDIERHARSDGDLEKLQLLQHIQDLTVANEKLVEDNHRLWQQLIQQRNAVFDPIDSD